MNHNNPLVIGTMILLLAFVMIMVVRVFISQKKAKAAAKLYERLIEEFNADAIILTYNLRGTVNMTNPCYVLACDEELIFTSALGSAAQWHLPYAKILSYKINYESDAGAKKFSPRDFYLNSVRSVTFEYQNDFGAIESFYMEKTYQPEPRDFNRYAFTQNNFYLAVKGKLSEKESMTI